VPEKPAAFMSYVRFDDEHDDYQLSQFRERLSAEVRAQTGEEFRIFQDRNDIQWGQNWQERIEDALDAVTLLLVIITPSFFRSPPCRYEVERFLRLERERQRTDLIYPVYYITAREMDDPVLRESNELARLLATRQQLDWRELRHEPFTSPTVRKAIAQAATQLRNLVWQGAGQGAGQAPVQPGGRNPAQGQAMRPAEAEAEGAIRVDPPTRVVDAFHRGDFVSISEAIKAANPGDRILVRPGLYTEGLVVDKPLEIIGDGDLAEVVVRASGADALLFKANFGRVVNLTLRQAGGKGKWFGVDITQGRLDLEGCDISSENLACVAIRGRADPRLRGNRIHDGKVSGVFVYDNGFGTLEDNDITGNTHAGIVITTGGNPTVRRNRIHDGKTSGIHVYNNGLGTFEDNDITGNALAGVEIRAAGNPTLRRNRIHDGRSAGVLVYDNGLGTLEDNDITANTLAGVEIKSGGHPTLRANRINQNRGAAVYVHDAGRAVIEDNDLSGNGRGPWDLSKDCIVTRSRNRE